MGKEAGRPRGVWQIQYKLHVLNIHVLACRTTPPWWTEAGERGSKKLYQPEPRPVVYVVPITSILGRLALIPAGDHCTIPAAMRNRKKELVEYGKCDKSRRPGTFSKLYYINSWAMCWPTDHAEKPLNG
jgi:hypothetical protein